MKVVKKNYLSRNFDPTEIEERYATEADKELGLLINLRDYNYILKSILILQILKFKLIKNNLI